MWDLRKWCMVEDLIIINVLLLFKESFLFWWKVGLFLSLLFYVYVYIIVCMKFFCGSGLFY